MWQERQKHSDTFAQKRRIDHVFVLYITKLTGLVTLLIQSKYCTYKKNSKVSSLNPKHLMMHAHMCPREG